uniref:Uncharacterized protein n=1 Tax=Knipowitschia caucasica TaxID=637954 RepID=A0AAV2M4Y2_KNICA
MLTLREQPSSCGLTTCRGLVELNDSSATTSVSGSDVVDDKRRDEEGGEMEEAEPFVDDNDEELTEESLNFKPEADTGQLLPSDSKELHNNNNKTDGESEIDTSVFPQMFCNMDEGSAATEFQEANSAPLPGFDSFTAVSMELGFMELVRCRRSKSPDDLVYCKFCLGLYAKNHLWRHVKNSHSEEYVRRRKKRPATINDEASLLLLEESFYNPFTQGDMKLGEIGAGSDLEKLIEASFNETFLEEMSESTKDMNVLNDSQNDASVTENTSEATLSEATLSEATASEATASEATASEATASEATASEATASEATASEATASEATVPSEATASEATASEATPSEATPSEATPSEATVFEALSCSVPKKNGKKMKRRWTGEEVAAVQRHMTDFIARCRVPGRKFCDQCLRSEPEALKRRDWRDIKNFVHNRIMASKKKTR